MIEQERHGPYRSHEIHSLQLTKLSKSMNIMQVGLKTSLLSTLWKNTGSFI